MKLKEGDEVIFKEGCFEGMRGVFLDLNPENNALVRILKYVEVPIGDVLQNGERVEILRGKYRDRIGVIKGNMGDDTFIVEIREFVRVPVKILAPFPGPLGVCYESSQSENME